MIWKCKYCDFACDKRGQILKHYRIKHGSHSRNEPFPCPHQECLCTFRGFGALKTHLSRFHLETPLQPAPRAVKLRCLLCEFHEPCNDAAYFNHIRSRHLRDNQKVPCPFKGCTFESRVYSTFNAHKSKEHRGMDWTMFKSEIVGSTGAQDLCRDDTSLEINAVDTDDTNDEIETPVPDCQHLCEDLEHKLAALFLKMQTVLHVPETSVQEIIQQLVELVQLSQAPLYNKVKGVLQKYHTNLDEALVREVVETFTDSNIITACCGKDGCLATIKRRASYVLCEFPLVMPIEYVVEKGKKTVAYVPLLQMLQKLLHKQDIFQKASSVSIDVPNEYNTCRDGKRFRENDLLCSDELTLALCLYIDDFELANPLGTSKGKHKMCAVYWTIANIPVKYRSTLHSIQLALLCNTTTIKECGYEKALYPLICDLVSLEQHGVYIENLGKCVKGTVLFVSADNLGAHSLAGFYESFSVDKFCRFCMASRSDAQRQEMASSTAIRVILTEADIRKIKLTSEPSSVPDLIVCIKNTLGLDIDFTLQFRDPEFDNELCNLTDLSELPEKPTVKVIPVLDLISLPSSLAENLNDTVSTADTELLSTSSVETKRPWPDEFCIPKFSVDVEYRLRQGNLTYLKDGTYLKATKELKHDILHKLAEMIYSFKAYPTTHDLDLVAKALTATHPCLLEPASPSSYCGWKHSLKDKMGNYRSKMRSLGHEDVKVNAGKRGRDTPNGEPPHKNIKKPKKGEVNYLPNIPDGHNTASLEEARELLVDEMKKKNPDGTLIRQKMDVTLSLRRKEVVQDKPPVTQILQRWPALFMENQVYQEFYRVVGKGLKQEFYDSLDRHCPALVDVMKSKRGLKGQLLDVLLRQTQTSDISDMRCLVLRGLPVLLGDNPSDFFKACFAVDDDDSYKHVPVGILTFHQEAVAQHFLNPSSLGLVLEGKVVMDNLKNLPQAMCLLFGLTYALHLNYPKCMVNTFHFIQQVLLGLGRKELKGKMLTLTNQLAM